MGLTGRKHARGGSRGFKVQGSRFKVQGSRFKVQGSRFKVQGLKFKPMKVERFEDLEIWKDARALCKYIFEITEKGSGCKGNKLHSIHFKTTGT
jgi:hypothetical protein